LDHRIIPIDHGYHGSVFITALGELRGSFGIHLATLATSYGLDMEDELASILRASPEDETANH